MNPKFKWLILGGAGLAVLIVLLICIAACQPEEVPLPPAEEPTPTASPTAPPVIFTLEPTLPAIEPDLPVTPTQEPSPTPTTPPIEPELPITTPTPAPASPYKPITITTTKPAATAAPVVQGESTVVINTAKSGSFSFALPESVYTDTVVHIKAMGAQNTSPVQWIVTKDGTSLDTSAAYSGILDNSGGYITFREAGKYTLTANGAEATIQVYPVLNVPFTVPASTYRNTEIEVKVNDSVVPEGQPIAWKVVYPDGTTIDVANFSDQGGKISFKELGRYTITAQVTDPRTGRIFEHRRTVNVFNRHPNAPKGTAVVTTERVNAAVKVNLSATATDPDGDTVTLEWSGRTADDTYKVGKHVVRVRAKDAHGAFSAWTEIPFEVLNAPPDAPIVAAVVHREDMVDNKILVTFEATATDPDGDSVTYEWEGRSDNDRYALGTHTVRVRAIDIYNAASEWTEVPFEVPNAPPSAPTATATIHRNDVIDCKALVIFEATATDPDGDPVTYEWEGRDTATNDHYALGAHTVCVRAVDCFGAASAWTEVPFEITNQAPGKPEITRNPADGYVFPGNPVTIIANATDPDGDALTYIWDNRPSETHIYPDGRQVVRVKAVDPFGAESPRNGLMFMVGDPNRGGGMMLTGPDSYLEEPGIEEATLTGYTFTVPPVDGHNGDDYGRVRGYNRITGQWDELDYGTTSNGISFSRTLEPGIYTKLQMQYYTNHDCMYNKSNITYTATFAFDE